MYTALHNNSIKTGATRTLVLLAVAWLAVTAADAQLFVTAATLPVGMEPYDVAAGDFNMDGALDLAVANASSQTVSILPGHGDGTFSPQQTITFAIAQAPTAVAVADINSDGFPDLAVLTGGVSTLAILFSDGAGAFPQRTSTTTANGTSSLAIGDLNGDTLLDVILTRANDNLLQILLGNGDGTFTSQLLPTIGVEPISVAVADLTGDGVLDLAVANNVSANVTILPGAGDGTFLTQTNFPIGAFPNSVAIGDLDNDGDLDVSAANTSDGTVSILLNTGAGVFAPQQTFAAGINPFRIVVKDFDNNGSEDIAVVIPAFNGNSVNVLLGQGDGTFAQPLIFPVGDAPLDFAAGDFDSDGDLDVVTSNRFSNDATVLINTTNAPPPTNPADFNGDGVVNGADLAALLTQWGPCPTPPASCPADISGSGDGVVNGGDLAFLLINWGPVN